MAERQGRLGGRPTNHNGVHHSLGAGDEDLLPVDERAAVAAGGGAAGAAVAQVHGHCRAPRAVGSAKQARRAEALASATLKGTQNRTPYAGVQGGES